jgi:hypothetical protein
VNVKEHYSIGSSNKEEGHVIESKTVFPCFSDKNVLGIAKASSAEDYGTSKVLRAAVSPEYAAATALQAKLSTEFDLPVVVCEALLPEVKLPKLPVRDSRGLSMERRLRVPV